MGSVGSIWKFRRGTSLRPRLTLFASGDWDDVSSAARAEVYVVQALSRHIALRAGYVGWRVRSERDRYDSYDQSPIRLDFSGFALGLDLMF